MARLITFTVTAVVLLVYSIKPCSSLNINRGFPSLNYFQSRFGKLENLSPGQASNAGRQNYGLIRSNNGEPKNNYIEKALQMEGLKNAFSGMNSAVNGNDWRNGASGRVFPGRGSQARETQRQGVHSSNYNKNGDERNNIEPQIHRSEWNSRRHGEVQADPNYVDRDAVFGNNRQNNAGFDRGSQSRDRSEADGGRSEFRSHANSPFMKLLNLREKDTFLPYEVVRTVRQFGTITLTTCHCEQGEVKVKWVYCRGMYSKNCDDIEGGGPR